jgi:tetratricopeptide (TPR) repeat protein
MTKAALRKSVVAALFVMVGALNACTYWGGDLERIVDESERDFRRNLGGPFADTSMRSVISNPTAYKYIDVRFDAILNRVGEKAFVPFVTTFTSERYISFSAWPADAKLWTAEDRSKSHPLFFVAKGDPNIPDLVGAGRFSLVRISGRVMGDYEMQAWFEVNRIEVIEAHVYTEEALSDLTVAKQAMADKKPAVAIRHYENALGGIWTTSLRLEIHLSLARLYEGRGDLEAALKHYNGALTNAPENEEAIKGRERVKAALSGQPAAPQQ